MLERDKQFTLKKKLKIYLFTGLLVSLPVVGSFWILSFLFYAFTDFIYQFVSPMDLTHLWERIMWRVLAFIFLFVVVILIGLLARNYIGKKMIRFGEQILEKIPILNKVYSVLKQIFESLWGEGKSPFRSVVLVEFPRDGIYSMGFITSESKGEIREKIGDGMRSVFIPTAPNPTTGFFIWVSSDQLIEMKMSVEEAFKMIISSGVVSPN